MSVWPYTHTRNNIFLAPLAGYTDAAFRLLCKEQGAGLTFTEMASAQAIVYGNRKTLDLLKIVGDEGRVGVQLFGREPAVLAKAAAFLEEWQGSRIALFDVNMGGPMPKIVNNGEGAALMRDPRRAMEIVRAIKEAVRLPVTVKIRKGWDENTVNAVEFACQMEDAGADGITVHGRTRAQMYEGPADLEIIRDVKRAVAIPVVGNGDIFDIMGARRMLDTGCDGLMIARGALGNPFLFAQIHAWLHSQPYHIPTLDERMQMAMRHVHLACALKGERIAVREMRKHAALYLKGMHGAAALRRAVVQASSAEELCVALGALRTQARDDGIEDGKEPSA